jgi:WD40-like Beta Propeller Repeat
MQGATVQSMSVALRICSLVGVAGLAACDDGGGMTDPDATPRRCNPTAAFGTPKALAMLNTAANEEQASLSLDEMTLYFSRDGGANGYDIYEATRNSTTAAFTNALPVIGVNTAAEDRYPRMTGDGLAIFATSKATRTSGFRVTSATRDSKTGAFGMLLPVAMVNGNDPTNDSDPFITADGRVLYFSSDRTGNFALYRSTQTSGQFTPPALVPGIELDTVYMELTPVVTPDELTMYFASSRTCSDPRCGVLDIYQATRATASDPFPKPTLVSELNSHDVELPSWVSADNCELYFTRFDPARGLELASAFRGM